MVKIALFEKGGTYEWLLKEKMNKYLQIGFTT